MLKHAKVIFLLAFFSLLLFTSCKKDHDSNSGATSLDYYIKFTVDGTEVLFINNAEGTINVIDAGGKYTFSGAALKVAGTAASNIASLSISNATPITANITYVNYAYAASGYQRAVLSTVSYIDATGKIFNSWGDEFASTGIVSNSKINFSEINGANLKGSFSGTTYKSISGAAEKHVITNGMFNLKRR